MAMRCAASSFGKVGMAELPLFEMVLALQMAVAGIL